MRSILRITKHATRFAVILAATLVGTTYFSVGSALAGAGDDKKEVVVKEGVVHVILQVKDVKVEPVVKEAKAELKTTSNSEAIVRNINNPFIRRVNPFFFRPFLFNEDELFFGE